MIERKITTNYLINETNCQTFIRHLRLTDGLGMTLKENRALIKANLMLETRKSVKKCA